MHSSHCFVWFVGCALHRCADADPPRTRTRPQAFWASADVSGRNFTFSFGRGHASRNSQIACTQWMPIKLPFSNFKWSLICCYLFSVLVASVLWHGPLHGRGPRIHSRSMVYSRSMWYGPALGFHFHPCFLATTQLFAPASLILMLLTICEIESSSNIVPVYHKLSHQSKVYEDLLHHDLAYPSCNKIEVKLLYLAKPKP